MQEPFWQVRLTPEMKSRLTREGLPLLTGLTLADILRQHGAFAPPPDPTAPGTLGALASSERPQR